jgi:hypothetical protein
MWHVKIQICIENNQNNLRRLGGWKFTPFGWEFMPFQFVAFLVKVFKLDT